MNKAGMVMLLAGLALAGCLEPRHEALIAERDAERAEYLEREKAKSAEDSMTMAAIAKAVEETMTQCASDYAADLVARTECVNIVTWESYNAANGVYPGSYSKEIFDLYAAETVTAAVARSESRISTAEFNARLRKATAEHSHRQKEYRDAIRRDRQDQYQMPPSFSCIEHRGVLTCQ